MNPNFTIPPSVKSIISVEEELFIKDIPLFLLPGEIFEHLGGLSKLREVRFIYKSSEDDSKKRNNKKRKKNKNWKKKKRENKNKNGFRTNPYWKTKGEREDKIFRGFGFCIALSKEIADAIIKKKNQTFIGGKKICIERANDTKRTHKEMFFQCYYKIKCSGLESGNWLERNKLFINHLFVKKENTVKFEYELTINLTKKLFSWNVVEFIRIFRRDGKYWKTIEKIIEFELLFDDLREIIFDKKNNKIILTITHPPKFFEVRKLYLEKIAKKRTLRTIDFTEDNLIAKNFVYIFHYDESELENIEKLIKICEEYHLIGSDHCEKIVRENFIYTNEKPENFFQNFIDELSGEVGYLIMCCITNGIFIKSVLNLELLEAFKKTEELVLQKFFYDIFFEKSIIYNLKKRFSLWKMINSKSKYDGESDLLPHQNLMKRIHVTPASIQVLPEEIDIGNRVLREYLDNEKFFARVSFVDEGSDERKIFFSKDIGKRIEEILNNGIIVGKYHFKLLAFSNSQLRSSSCWMFSEVGRLNTNSAINNIAKYAARIGHTLSTTKETYKLEKFEFITIRDYETRNKKYIFSDGCGLIDLNFAKRICKLLEISKCYSGYQFRFAGYKGVVCAYDFKKIFKENPILVKLVEERIEKSTEVNDKDDSKLILRDSQKKFLSEHITFEVIKISNFSPCYLNR